MTNHRRVWALITTGVFIGAALMLALGEAFVTPQQEYERALRTWEARAPARYQLDFTLSGDEISGRFRAEIEGGLVRSLIDTASGRPLAEAGARTLERVLPVEQLFARLAEAYRPSDLPHVDLVRRHPELRRPLAMLGLTANTCWLPGAQRVSYDQALGYPRRLTWDANRCDGGMFSLDSFALEITALRPLP